jgi:hypothetical protein
MRIWLVLLLVLGLPLGAGQAREGAEPEAESLRLARLVIEGSGLARSFHGQALAMRENILRLATTRPELAADLQIAIDEMQPDFNAEAESMTTKASALYAQKFSRRELADIAVFFAGASGKAYVAAQPALLGELGATLDDWRQTASLALMARLRDKLRAKGKDF